MRINENTKISELIRFNKDAIEALASINSHFEKLKNPVLRKLLASRVSIRDAAKIGGASVDVFYSKLRPLGFICENSGQNEVNEIKADLPKLLMKHSTVRDLDVRPVLASGKDPFNEIMDAVKVLPNGCSLRVINTFEPTPLIRILEKKGFICDAVRMSDTESHTYIKRTESSEIGKSVDENVKLDDHSSVLKKFENNLVHLDVRQLDMPKPMISILEILDTLPLGKALFVKHKKVPQFLFPELAEKNFQWSIRELSENEVDLIIYRK